MKTLNCETFSPDKRNEALGGLFGLVTNVSISSPTPTSLSLSWNPPDDPWYTEESYRYEIKYQLQQIGYCNPNQGPLINHTSDTSSTAVEVNDIDAFSNYNIYLRAIKNGHYGMLYNTSFRTMETGMVFMIFHIVSCVV